MRLEHDQVARGDERPSVGAVPQGGDDAAERAAIGFEVADDVEAQVLVLTRQAGDDRDAVAEGFELTGLPDDQRHPVRFGPGLVGAEA
jgi:hypothetical protein